MVAREGQGMSPVVVFDLFGTLLDIASIRNEVAHVAADPAALVTTWRDKQIAYSFASALMNRYADFDRITHAALRFALAKHGVTLAPDRERDLVRAWERVRAYDDAAPLLERLHFDGIRCAVLTNGTLATARAAIASAGLTSRLDAVLSVDQLGTYKPDMRVYALVTEHYAVRPKQVVFVSSNGWDATGAAAFGFRVAWCNRAGVPAETLDPQPEWTIERLYDVQKLVATV